jgi:hypothetical protein
MAETLLGVGHPLAAVIHSAKTARDQVAVVAAIQVVAGILLYENAPFAVPLAVAGGVVQALQGCRLAVLRSRRRDICRELIISGGDWLPLDVVQGESRRLSSCRHQARLAGAVDQIAEIADSGRCQGHQRGVISDVSVLRRSLLDLREIAALLLLLGGAGVRGVALVERLLMFGDSALYGTELEQLRQELSRARSLLARQS